MSVSTPQISPTVRDFCGCGGVVEFDSSKIMDEFKITAPATVMISGGSQSGKTTLVSEMITRLDEVFDRPPHQIVYCYSRDQPAYDEIKKKASIPIEFVEGLDPSLRPKPGTLLIIDDLQDKSELIQDYFTKNTHHFDLITIYITQNLFLKTAHHRNCNLNTHVLCVFKNPRDKLQISCLARQIYPNNNKFLMDSYAQATEKAHGYLVLNLQQRCPEAYRVRDSFFPKDAHFFVDKKGYNELKLDTL